MLDQLTHATFAPLVGKQFVVHVNETNTVEMELIQATPLPIFPGPLGKAPRRAPFSLIFRGPLQQALEQRIYRVEQADFGAAGIFLVPIGPDEVGQRYESIFN
jgi:hypothetical protein